MRKFLSTFLAITMLLTSFSNVLAVESEDSGEFNSLKIPVINEVRDENTEELDALEMNTFSFMSDSTTNDRPATGGSSFGGSGGGGSSTVKPGIDVSMPSDDVLTITTIPKQTAGKGDQLIIEDAESVLGNDYYDVVDYYENCGEYSSVIEYEKDNDTSVMYYGEQVFGDIYTDNSSEEIIIPVPVELENGTYTVRVHQLNNLWDWRDGAYAELAAVELSRL